MKKTNFFIMVVKNSSDYSEQNYEDSIPVCMYIINKTIDFNGGHLAHFWKSAVPLTTIANICVLISP